MTTTPRASVPCLAVRSAVVHPRAVATLDILRAENLAALAAHPGVVVYARIRSA